MTLGSKTRDELLDAGRGPETTPFDYIIVGSGAGGGPLAARLALNGKTVLLIDAGIDIDPESRDVYQVPAYHAAATEEPEITWDFSVRHYADTEQQKLDSKYIKDKDPSANGTSGRGGIQYPRAAAIGGCTSHYAMIIIRPNDADWDQIACSTGDASWRSENMQGYFGKIEKCLYYTAYRGFAGEMLGGLLKAVRYIAIWLNPRRQLDPGGHGSKGWQTTSFIDPLVIAAIARGDKTLLGLLKKITFAFFGTRRERSMLLRAVGRLQLLQFLDPNVRSPYLPNRDRLSLISIGTDGIRRNGLREHLLNVVKQFPQRLIILNPAHATRIVFARDDDTDTQAAPKAVGVEVQLGKHLYRASPMHDPAQTSARAHTYFARLETIVCAGAFNTPQLLMLSGIGDREHLQSFDIPGPRDQKGDTVSPIVDLPGVGKNLQDRYEVSVISEATSSFSTLKGTSFDPDDRSDATLQQWKQDGTGLYSTNGGAIAFMMSSHANKRGRPDPDLFIFGIPAAFRGYYWGWSRQLLRKSQNAQSSCNLWSWIILKAYTGNNQGLVRLKSREPMDMPIINFNSFPDCSTAGSSTTADVEALAEAVEVVRRINNETGAFKEEVQPGHNIANHSSALHDWIKNEAWGHHACGTCRMGSEPHRTSTADLRDGNAVVDSRFQVHGVKNLRVVDTSIFPSIPGYFIAMPTFMIGEKAADVLLADTDDYPHQLQAEEAAKIRMRRKALQLDCVKGQIDPSKLPADTIGLALSGGGIRSATFCLGLIQALAKTRRLRDIDIVSTASGGGYIAGFLGRLFTRMPQDLPDKAARVESILADSPEIDWLRVNAQYIDGGGRGDALADAAIVLRNLVSVHLWLGTLVFGIFGLTRWLAITFVEDRFAAPVFAATLSAWWWLPCALLLLLVLPPAVGYWLVTPPPAHNRRALIPFGVWLTILGCAVYGLALPGAAGWCGVAIAVLLLSLVLTGMARWGISRNEPSAAPGDSAAAEDENSADTGVIVRNRLTRLFGIGLFGFALSIVWVMLDTLAQQAARSQMPIFGWSIMGLVPLLPLLRTGASSFFKSRPNGAPPSTAKNVALPVALSVLTLAMVFLLLIYLDMLAHMVFQLDIGTAAFCVIAALLVSAVLGQALSLLNLSSLQQAYSQKLVRTFLGASNDARVHPSGNDTPVPVNVSHLGDDIDFDEYHPEQTGGPLHLIGTCLNNTVDPLSGNLLRDDKGMPMCVGPAGISVGRRFHTLWDQCKTARSVRQVPVTAIRVAPDPHAFHVLSRSDDQPVKVERLRLGQWMAISGAALATGSGRKTRLWLSLALGLVNLRTGYWWNSGIAAGQRPGHYPPSLWRAFKSLPSTVFALQASLLNEWRGYFAGPAARNWYLSDGGHFDNTGLYELIRRRLPIMIAADATSDPSYVFDDLALLTRQVRLDFGAEIQWLTPGKAPVTGVPGTSTWTACSEATGEVRVPGWIANHVQPGAVGTIEDMKRSGPRGAALAQIIYADGHPPGWLLLVKPCLLTDLPTDLRTYAAMHGPFPNEGTLDQFFDDSQWEAYRKLGETAGLKLFGKS